MFKHYKHLSDVVSLLVYCPSDRSFLVSKDTNGELWIPSNKAENGCWKNTASKMYFELFGTDTGSQCQILRVCKIWLPNHQPPSVCHAVFKVPVKSDIKKRVKMKPGMRTRLQWMTYVELDRQRAHSTLRSPELALFVHMAIGELRNIENMDLESGPVVEVCEDGAWSTAGAGGAVAFTPHQQLLHVAGYTRDDEIRVYREFMTLVYPALYMSAAVFAQFMVDLGWQRADCPSLFRAADTNGRGGLSHSELVQWVAALEPATLHSGAPAEIRCKYIFRYFDSDRDSCLDYGQFKEVVGAARAARRLPVDALSVVRDADLCLRQLGIQPNSPVTLSEFMRAVGEKLLRGTSALLRAPKSIAGYLADLHGHDRDKSEKLPIHSVLPATSSTCHMTGSVMKHTAGKPEKGGEYGIAGCVMQLHPHSLTLVTPLTCYDEDAVTPSTSCLLVNTVNSMELLGPTSLPNETFAAVHYFANPIEKTFNRRTSGGSACAKAAWSWSSAAEQAHFGDLVLRLADAVRAIFQAETRLTRITSPVYAIGDLHGNLEALLAMEQCLWKRGPALGVGLLLLGDYVDRGLYGVELVAYLLAAKLQRPHNVCLLRGNHETRDIQKMFTFYNECVTKFGETEGPRVWEAINQVFDVLPLAAVVDERVFCCHGGIPPPWLCPLISAIDKIPVPLPRPVEQSAIAWELMWNDPVKPSKVTATLAAELAAGEGFAANGKRGTAHVFSARALLRFLAANRLALVLRAHELQRDGFMLCCGGRLVSVFSSAPYCGAHNRAALALLHASALRILTLQAAN